MTPALERATQRVPTSGPDDLAGEVRLSLLGCDYGSASLVAVLDRGRPLGLVPIEEVLAAPPATRMATLLDGRTATAPADLTGEELINLVAGNKDIALVDHQGRFRGLVPPRDMVDLLEEEHEQDLARLGGYMAGAKRARGAAEEPVRDRLWHRLPWLILGLIGAMASAVIVGSFEAQLNEVVLLAFFLPAVVYMADAVGTQTETVLIRAFAAGVDVRTIVVRELLTGVLAGLAVGAAFFPFAYLGWGDASVAAAVSLALLASCSIATAVAMILPSIFNARGVDPAFGSGPLATIAQDLLSIAVYLAIAAPLAT